MKSCCQIIYDRDRVCMGERKRERVCVTWRECVCVKEKGLEGGREGEREWVCVYMWAGMFPSVLYRVAVCCSALQCTAVCCIVLQCVAGTVPSVLYRVAVRCCVLTVYCSVLSVLQCAAVCCSVLQCVAVCCSVLQCAAVCCSSAIRHDSE